MVKGAADIIVMEKSAPKLAKNSVDSFGSISSILSREAASAYHGNEGKIGAITDPRQTNPRHDKP